MDKIFCDVHGHAENHDKNMKNISVEMLFFIYIIITVCHDSRHEYATQAVKAQVQLYLHVLSNI